MDGDKNLLFGAVAMQAELITADQFAEACSLWSKGKGSDLPAILCERGWLLPEDRAHVEYLVERKLARFNSDVHASLAGYTADIRNVLASVCDETNAGSATNYTLAYDSGGTGETHAKKPNQRYDLRTLHAAGGIGEIWVARDADLERDVAVKRLQSRKSGSSIAKTRFLREARITGRLDHPGIVPIYELCLDEATGQPFYSMRFLKGRTLTEAVQEHHKQRGGRADPQEFLGLLNAFCIVCNTVAYAHSKGIVHRDLKCENVILGDFGEVVVIDWGLAKEVDGYEFTHADESDDEQPENLNPAATLAGHILGTPAYMAPEQAAGRLDLIGPSTDVYGLCAILYEILCGRPPFVGNTIFSVLKQVQSEPPVRPSEIVSGVPLALEQICLKGLAKAQGDRHSSADQLAKKVHAWVSDLAERRQAEEERERFFALSLDLLAIVDSDGRLRQVGPAWETLLGYDRGQLEGGLLVDCIHADDRDILLHRMRETDQPLSTDAFEARALHLDGSYRWISWNVTPLPRERSWYFVGRDITELKKSQQLFEGVLQSAPDAMVMINPQGRMVMVNRQTEHLFGYAQEDLIGQRVEILIPERFRERHPAHVATFFATSSVRPMGSGRPLHGRRKDGTEFLVDIALSPIKTEDGSLVAASVRDVSDRRSV